MKRILTFILTFAFVFSLISCGKEAPVTATETETAEKRVVRIYAMTGPTGMGLSSIICGDDPLYETQLFSTPDQVIAPIVNKSCDIAAVPINLAATLYQKTQGDIVILCANTLGVLSLVENGEEIQSAQDLAGKTIYAPNPGSTPEYILRYVLQENGIDPDKDVTLKFLSGGDEVAAQLVLEPDAVGMLPEPKLSAFLSQNTAFRKCLDMTQEWDKVSGGESTLIQGVFVARREFAKENPDLIKKFLSDYNKSQKLICENPEEGAKLIVEAGILPQEGLAKKAIPGCNITYLDGKEMKRGVKKCLTVLYEFNPKSVGGALPEDDIYYEK